MHYEKTLSTWANLCLESLKDKKYKEYEGKLLSHNMRFAP